MSVARFLAAFTGLLPALASSAAVLQVENLTSTQIAKLDPARTVVVLVGGILEEHGPYLPAYTDGFISQRLAADVSAAVGNRDGWTALVFPQIPLGSSAANEIGGRYVFPGSYVLRNETLRAVYMDLASQLGEAGFRHILIVHLHGAPLQNRMLDQASDYFRDVYKGRMLHLYGLMRVVDAWSAASRAASEEANRAEAFCVHACFGETSVLMHVQPKLVDPAYAKAPPWAGESIAELRELARRKGWPGYFGAPQFASPKIGQSTYDALSREMVAAALDFLDGRDDRLGKRFSDVAGTDPVEQEIDRAALAYEQGIADKQRKWLQSRRR